MIAIVTECLTDAYLGTDVCKNTSISVRLDDNSPYNTTTFLTMELESRYFDTAPGAT